MQISIEISDSSPISQLTPAYLKNALIAALYHAGKVSSKQACAVLGMSRRQFEELLPEFGFSILRDDANTIQAELNA